MSAPRVVVTAELPGGAHALLTGCDVTLLAGPGEPSLARAIEHADGLLCMLTDRIDRALLERARRLRVVGVYAVGHDNIDLGACRERGIVVCHTPNVLTDATADFAWALLLAAARRVVEGDRLVRSGAFAGWRPDLLLGRDVAGATLGLVGFGRIGRAVARRAAGFGMRVLYWQRRAVTDAEALGASFVALERLLAESDFVSLHVPGSPDTRHLLDATRFASMKPGAVLVNTARGAVCDERALVEALLHGPLGAAGLDVFEREPALDPRLLQLPNVVLAPHAASATHAVRLAMARAIGADVAAVLRGEPAQHVVS